MTENSDDVLKSIGEGLEKKLNEVKEEILEKLESKTEKVLEELQLIRGRLDDVEMKKKSNFLEKKESEDSLMEAPKDSSLPISGKRFVLKHTFKDVMSMKDGLRSCSLEEEYFGVPWKFYIYKKLNHLGFFTSCDLMKNGEWTIEAKSQMLLISSSGDVKKAEISEIFGVLKGNKEQMNWGFQNFIELEEMKNVYLIDGELRTEVHLEIKKTIGINEPNLRYFNESDCSDIALIVNEKKFHVLKLYLATHSSYFKSMFLGQFNESEKTEITLTGIDSDDFQKYLEVLYGESAIDEFTVEGLLLLADMYDTDLVIRKCQKFLLQDSNKTLKTKLRIAFRYNLDELKKNCLSEIKTIEDIRSVIAGDINDMDPSVTSALLGKCITFNQ